MLSLAPSRYKPFFKATDEAFLLKGCLDISVMKKEFFLNLTRIIEANPKIYLSIIVGIAGCLVLFVAEAVHIQKIIELLNTKDQVVLRAAIEPIADKYSWSRWLLLILALIWSSFAYSSTKKKLGLKS